MFHSQVAKIAVGCGLTKALAVQAVALCGAAETISSLLKKCVFLKKQLLVQESIPKALRALQDNKSVLAFIFSSGVVGGIKFCS
jgi:SpoU rRNA methylase family enzyme